MTTAPRLAALAAAIATLSLPAAGQAFSDCPANHVMDGYTCDMQKGAGKNGGHFRVTFPSDWDGDLVIINHGFDLNDRKIRPHEVCSHNLAQACEQNSDCGPDRFCNNISYLGLDEVLLPMGKAVAASTYSASGWAVFESAKDIKDVIRYVEKDSGRGDDLKRVIVAGFSLGGAVTADATLKLNIDGAVPLCGAVAGGLTTWDLAMDVRMIYDFLCDDVPGAKFNSAPDVGEENTGDSDDDSLSMALVVDACFGNIGFVPDDGFQDQRRADFIAITGFTGGEGINLSSAMGFATLGLGDFVQDEDRLKGARIGLNDTLDYTELAGDPMLTDDVDAGIERLTAGKGRKKLRKASWPDFTKGKGKNVDYPILSIGGAGDWLVIPEFQRVYETAATTGGKNISQVWQDQYGHCVFTEYEMRATFSEYFEWLGPVDSTPGPAPTTADVEAACVAAGGVAHDFCSNNSAVSCTEDSDCGMGNSCIGATCMFDASFTPGAIYDRIPARADWPAAALPPMP